MGTGLKVLGVTVLFVGAAGLAAVGVYFGYQSYLAFKAGEILQAIYLVIAASIFLRK